MSKLYVYYKVAPARAAELLPLLVDLQRRLREAMPGLACDIQRRTDAAATQDATAQTWMETYHFNGFADARAWSALDDALGTALKALPEGLMGERHAERFDTLSSARMSLGGQEH